jgi:hypothetical protein
MLLHDVNVRFGGLVIVEVLGSDCSSCDRSVEEKV